MADVPFSVYIRAIMSLKLQIIRSFQSTATWLIVKYLKKHGNLSTTLPFTFNANQRYLFVANHQSQFDPFAVFASLTYAEMLAIAPTRFMTAGRIYYSYLYPFLALCGCYPTHKNRDPTYDPVAQSIHYLENDQNVFIFPEGRINLQSESQPRMGVKRIFDGTRSSFTLVLIHLEWCHEGKRRNLKVVFEQGSEIESPESLMEQLYRL